MPTRRAHGTRKGVGNKKLPGAQPPGKGAEAPNSATAYFAIFSRAWYVDGRMRGALAKLFAILAIASLVVAFELEFPSPALVVARTCWIEGGFSEADCAGIVGALRNQAHATNGRRRVTPEQIAERAWAYSAIKKDSERIAFALKLPDGDEPTWNAATNRLWKAIRKTAADVIAGRRKNPCFGAWHWNARNLKREAQVAIAAVEAGKWRAVVCSEPTANAFFSVVR